MTCYCPAHLRIRFEGETIKYQKAERQRLEQEVVRAAMRRRLAHRALSASIPDGMPIPICHEYDAANAGYELALDALEAFEAEQEKR